MSSLVWLFLQALGNNQNCFQKLFCNWFTSNLIVSNAWRLYGKSESGKNAYTSYVHQYNKKCWIRLYTRVYFVQKSCNGAVVILYMQKCRQVKFIKILWAHTGYIMYKHLLRTFSITLNFDIKNSMYKILMVNGNENIQTKN